MADYIRLKYNEPALPVLADEDAESGVGNWVDSGGNHAITQSNDFAHSGTYSFKIHKTGAGDATTNYVYLPSASNTVYTVGKKYCITAWIKDAAGSGIWHFKTSGVDSTLSIDGLSTWYRFYAEITALNATTDLQVWKASGGTEDGYLDDIRIYECEDFNVLIEKGLTRKEKFSMYPEIINKALDGSTETQFKAYIRSCNLRTEALTSTQLIRYLSWCLDNDRLLDYSIQSTAEYDLVLIPEVEQEAQWQEDCRLMPYLEINLQEGVARTS